MSSLNNKNNNEIISFEEENTNIQIKSNKDNIDIDAILKKEDELLKNNKKNLVFK